jgi:hypothetical protein
MFVRPWRDAAMATDVSASAPSGVMLTSRSRPLRTSVNPLGDDSDRPLISTDWFGFTRSCSVGATPTDAWNWKPPRAISTTCRAGSPAPLTTPATLEPPVGDGRFAVADDAADAGVVVGQQGHLAARFEARQVDGDVAPAGHAHDAAGVGDDADLGAGVLARGLDLDLGGRQDHLVGRAHRATP